MVLSAHVEFILEEGHVTLLFSFSLSLSLSLPVCSPPNVQNVLALLRLQLVDLAKDGRYISIRLQLWF